MALTTQEKGLIGGGLVLGGLGYYYYTKSRQKTVPVTKTSRSTVISTRTNRTTPTQTIVHTHHTTATKTTTPNITHTIRLGTRHVTVTGHLIGYALNMSSQPTQVKVGSSVTITIRALQNVRVSLGNEDNLPMAGQTIYLSTPHGTQTLITNTQGIATTTLTVNQTGTVTLTAQWSSPTGTQTAKNTLTVTAAPITCSSQLVVSGPNPGLNFTYYLPNHFTIASPRKLGLTPGCTLRVWYVNAYQGGHAAINVYGYVVLISGPPTASNAAAVLSNLGWDLVPNSLRGSTTYYLQNTSGALGTTAP